MRKSIEMKKELEALKNKIKGLQAENKTKEAHAKLTELETLKDAIEVQEAIERMEDEEAANKAKPLTPAKDTKVEDATNIVRRAFNKQLLGKKLTAEEREYATNAVADTGQTGEVDDRGGYLLPKESVARIKELKRKLINLKDYCNVLPTTTREGNLPSVDEPTDELTNFDELNSLTEKQVKFSNVSYKICNYGDIIPIANTFLADTNADITGVVGNVFAKKAVNTENNKILALAKALTPVAITDYKGVISQLNKGLDPDIAADAVIITNQDGHDYLDQLTDSTGRSLVQTMLTDASKKVFKGKEIIVFANEKLANVDGAYPFFIGNLYEFVTFFDRDQYTMAVSTEAGFTKNVTYVKPIERFDVQKVDGDAMVYCLLTEAAE